MDKIYEAQYQSFVGKRFYHKSDPDLIYTFAEINEDERAVILDKHLESVEYDVEDVLGLIRDNIWIIEN